MGVSLKTLSSHSTIDGTLAWQSILEGQEKLDVANSVYGVYQEVICTICATKLSVTDRSCYVTRDTIYRWNRCIVEPIGRFRVVLWD